MRPWLGLLLFIPISLGALIYYRCTQEGRNEANIEQKQAGETSIPPAVHKPNTQTEQAKTYDAGKDCLYRLYLLATIAGVCVALGGIYAIYKQTEATAIAAKETARAAKAAEDSVTLQELALKQWVNIGHWHASFDKKRSWLKITFHVINPTKMPLTLHAILCMVAGHEAQRQDVGIAEDILAPDNPYVVEISFPLHEQQVERLINSEPVTVGLDCSVMFADSRNEHWHQRFNRIVTTSGRVLAEEIVPDILEVTNVLRKSVPPPPV
jgi:hypothetical protein